MGKGQRERSRHSQTPQTVTVLQAVSNLSMKWASLDLFTSWALPSGEFGKARSAAQQLFSMCELLLAPLSETLLQPLFFNHPIKIK